MSIGILVVLLGVLSLPQAVGAEWNTLTTPHFIIYFVPSERRFAQSLQERIEVLYDKVAKDIGGVKHPPIRLYIAPSAEVFTQLQPSLNPLPSWAAAAAYPDRNLIITHSPSVRIDGRMDTDRMLTHEIAHLLLAKAVGSSSSLPRWLDEGFAMYQAEEWGWDDAAVMTRISISNSFIPFSELTSGFPVGRRDAAAAYAQSFSFCAFLLEEYGRERFGQFLKLLGETGLVNTSMRRAFGQGLNKLEKNWQSRIRRRYTWIPVITSGSALWFVMAWLFIAGYLRKRSEAARRLEEMELEEASQWGVDEVKDFRKARGDR